MQSLIKDSGTVLQLYGLQFLFKAFVVYAALVVSVIFRKIIAAQVPMMLLSQLQNTWLTCLSNTQDRDVFVVQNFGIDRVVSFEVQVKVFT